jgi:hypothetical protein
MAPTKPTATSVRSLIAQIQSEPDCGSPLTIGPNARRRKVPGVIAPTGPVRADAVFYDADHVVAITSWGGALWAIVHGDVDNAIPRARCRWKAGGRRRLVDGTRPQPAARKCRCTAEFGGCPRRSPCLLIYGYLLYYTKRTDVATLETVDRVKFTCSTKDIASAVGAASKVVNAHTTVPILSNVLLTRRRRDGSGPGDRSRADARTVVPGRGHRERRGDGSGQAVQRLSGATCRPVCSS